MWKKGKMSKAHQWKVDGAIRRQQEYEMAIAEGIRRGKKAAEEEMAAKMRMLEVKEHIMRAMAQMMEAAAHLADNIRG